MQSRRVLLGLLWVCCCLACSVVGIPMTHTTPPSTIHSSNISSNSNSSSAQARKPLAKLQLTPNLVWDWQSPFECTAATDYRPRATTVDELWVWGERNTGTGYTQRLFDYNIVFSKEVIGGLKWKHGFIHEMQLSASTHTIFLFVVRDLFPWLVSMKKNPHYAHQFDKASMHTMVTSPWEATFDQLSGNRLDADPVSGKQFANILKLRTARLKDWLAVRECLPYAHTYRYSELYQTPEPIIKAMVQKHNLKLKRKEITRDICIVSYGDCQEDKGAKQRKQDEWFRRSYMDSFSQETLRFILESHDWVTEAEFGFDYSYVQYYLEKNN